MSQYSNMLIFRMSVTGFTAVRLNPFVLGSTPTYSPVHVSEALVLLITAGLNLPGETLPNGKVNELLPATTFLIGPDT
jgi:hypothetical protein